MSHYIPKPKDRASPEEWERELEEMERRYRDRSIYSYTFFTAPSPSEDSFGPGYTFVPIDLELGREASHV